MLAVAEAISVAMAAAVAMAVAVAVAVARTEAAAAHRLALRRVGGACCALVRRTPHSANWKAPKGARRLHLELSVSRGGIRHQMAVAVALAKVAEVKTSEVAGVLAAKIMAWLALVAEAVMRATLVELAAAAIAKVRALVVLVTVARVWDAASAMAMVAVVKALKAT